LLIKSFVEDLMYGRRQSPLFGAVLFVLSLLYGAMIRFRSLLFRLKLLRSNNLPCPVVSIGNITLGGTGKTPAVIAVAGFLSRRGKHPVVVSRGYGRTDEALVQVVSDGRSLLMNAQTGGDEPVLIASKLPNVPVVVGSSRYQAAQHALQQFPVDVVILDDGFQHQRLRRSLDIALVDATDPFGNGKLFPAGILREPVSALGRAQAIIVTRAGKKDSMAGLLDNIRRTTQAQIFTSVHQPIDLVDCSTGEKKPLSALRNAKAFVFSGIARPLSFTSVLTSLGVNIAAESVYPDHYHYLKSDLALIFKKAADARVNMIITTEKDMVRLNDLRPDGIWALRIELDVIEREEWEQFLSRML
jgi:tetraacyldisaccharide 4'-kinase